MSVTIPTFNYGHYIGKTIQSVLDQTFKDFEILILDNASTDDTKETVKGMEDGRIRYYKNEYNIGFVNNLNRCIQLANGKYISILHADDVYLPQMLEIASEILDANPRVGFVYSAYYTTNTEGEIIDLARPFATDHVWDSLEELRFHLLGNYVRCPTITVRSQVYQDVGMFDPSLHYASDWDMWLRIELHGYQVAYVACPLAYYRIHDQSGTSWVLREGLRAVEEYKVLRKVFGTQAIRNLIPEEELFSIEKKARQRLIDEEISVALLLLRDGAIRKVWPHVTSALSCQSILDQRLSKSILDLSAVWVSLIGGCLQLIKEGVTRRIP